MRDEERLAAAVRERIDQVDRRVRLTGFADAADREQIRLAAELVEPLRERLGLGHFQGALVNNTGRPQLVLGFASAELGDVVLKVYGKHRPGEAVAQRLWQRHGVPTAHVLAHGDDPATWLLMRRVGGIALTTADLAADDDLLRVTRKLASVMSTAHTAADRPVPGTRRLGVALAPYLDAAVGALTRHGYTAPPGWRAVGARLHTHGPAVLLHGDLGLGNVLRGRGGLCVLDASAYWGHAAFDAARWCARVAGPQRCLAALRAWLEVESALDSDHALALLGLELLLEGGVRESVKRQRGLPLDARDDVTLAYLARAREHLPA